MLVVVILAAGGSTRFGSPKQLAKIGGETLVRRAVRIASRWPVIVVTGSDGERVASEVRDLGAEVVHNEDWVAGMAGSIRAGVRRAEELGATAVLIMLCDQVAITDDDLARLAEIWQRSPDSIIASTYDAIVGVPAIFPRARFDSLRALHGDEGARKLLRSETVIAVAVSNAAIDIDRPSELGPAR
jgi:molybdenum cofactor cytidylyltransferase